LGASDFDGDRDEVVERALQAGVTKLITIGAGYGKQSALKAVELAERYACVFASVGLHPNDASEKFDHKFLEDLALHPKVVAIGETGLDFYRDYAPREGQERWFVYQIELALRVRKPLVIHSREAAAECLEVLQREGASKVGGVFHCFAEDVEFAAKLASINFLVSFPGSLTFKKAEASRLAASSIPLSQIMLETDAPFLAPEPFRGKRCESSYVPEIARMLAKVRSAAIEEIAQQTSANARRLFNLAE
ncbi:MAG: hydrolase TatD, partial [Proteobacteria bacterium]